MCVCRRPLPKIQLCKGFQDTERTGFLTGGLRVVRVQTVIWPRHALVGACLLGGRRINPQPMRGQTHLK